MNSTTKTLAKNGDKRIIHINQGRIRSNKKHGTSDPVITCKSHKAKQRGEGFCVSDHQNDYGHEFVMKDSDGRELLRLVYSPDKPQPCGAQVWIETAEEVELITRA